MYLKLALEFVEFISTAGWNVFWWIEESKKHINFLVNFVYIYMYVCWIQYSSVRHNELLKRVQTASQVYPQAEHWIMIPWIQPPRSSYIITKYLWLLASYSTSQSLTGLKIKKLSRDVILTIISTKTLHSPILKSLSDFILKGSSVLSPPGPEWDSETSGCPQFHFMPRFVRFLPGKTANNLPIKTAFLLLFCLPLVVSGDSVFKLKRATEETKRSCVFSIMPLPNISAHAGVCICVQCKKNDFQCLSSCVAAWRSSSVHMMVLVHYEFFFFLPAVFVMTAVPPTFFPSKNNFSPSSPNLVRYKHLSASFYQSTHKKKK